VITVQGAIGKRSILQLYNRKYQKFDSPPKLFCILGAPTLFTPTVNRKSNREALLKKKYIGNSFAPVD
jgi:hypothetical protein